MSRPRITALRKVQFFSGMSDEDLRMICRLARVKSHAMGEEIIRENTVADTFYIILEGEVAITKRFEDGEQIELDEHKNGDFFGEMALLDEGPRSASAVARKPSTLLEISRADFKELLSQAPLLAYAMMRELSRRLRGTGALLVSQLQRKNRELAKAYLDTVNAVVNTLEARDPYTRGHTERVTVLAKGIAEELGRSEEELFLIEIGALLHDVGKIGVPDAILHKPGPLVGEELVAIQEHPEKGRAILGSISYLDPVIPCVMHHHERYDGQGYPGRIAGGNIPLPGRIIAVADAFDAMTSDRPYRRKVAYPKAIEEIERNAGRQFDPLIVKAFRALWDSGRLEQLLAQRRRESGSTTG
jgi:HD-GYP domain-containing protein (c-di-GMP phosphodiesterase class II)